MSPENTMLLMELAERSCRLADEMDAEVYSDEPTDVADDKPHATKQEAARAGWFSRLRKRIHWLSDT